MMTDLNSLIKELLSMVAKPYSDQKMPEELFSE